MTNYVTTIIFMLIILTPLASAEQTSTTSTNDSSSAKQAIDPSDLTRVYTMASVWANNQNNVRATASWSGA